MGWMVNITLQPFYPRESSGAQCVGVWVGPRVGLDGRGKSCHPSGIQSSDRPAFSESLYRLNYPGRIFPFQTCIRQWEAELCLRTNREAFSKKRRRPMQSEFQVTYFANNNKWRYWYCSCVFKAWQLLKDNSFYNHITLQPHHITATSLYNHITLQPHHITAT
jgi:hypothetical protein